MKLIIKFREGKNVEISKTFDIFSVRIVKRSIIKLALNSISVCSELLGFKKMHPNFLQRGFIM